MERSKKINVAILSVCLLLLVCFLYVTFFRSQTEGKNVMEKHTENEDETTPALTGNSNSYFFPEDKTIIKI